MTIPSDMSYSLQISTDSSCSSGKYYSSDGVLSCGSIARIAGTIDFKTLKFIDPTSSWEMVSYGNKSCNSQPDVTAGLGDLTHRGKCINLSSVSSATFSSSISNVRIRPLWNAAYEWG